MKRTKWWFLGALLLGLVAGSFYFWPSSTIEIVRLDSLGTKIQPNKLIHGKVGFPLSRKRLKIEGYRIQHHPDLRFKQKKYRVEVAYEPRKSASQLTALVRKAKYVGATFQVLNTGLGNQRQNYRRLRSEEDRLRIILSEDGIHWATLETSYPNVAVRDPSIIKLGSKWWIVYTGGAMWTENFRTWHHVYLNYNPNNQFQKVWAPEFYRLKNGQVYLVAAASTDGVHFKLLRYSFNSKQGTIGAPEQLNVGETSHNNLIDPHITTSHSGYVLWAKDETRHYLVKASSKDGVKFTNFTRINIKMSAGLTPEGPTTIDKSAHSGLLFFDLYNMQETFTGVHFVKFENDKLISSPTRIKSDFLVRHFSVYRSNK
ncbi:hypothetical protein CFI14_16105 [Lactiplantibacillus pentosus]|uniref:hypothetical protein n=1 Tax=Lactiplantibacillus pentosus TaxID=1589 RepID=UPI000EA9747D|nr:hypothetical protein [Lactiplantibacillus pentosus]AYG36897.1 hypothetical protein CFK27_02525 [Lactiplantibacillus pentosus]AYG42526.1 hypothetical protein CFI14_16105 [Lactiplantibacillus pentosus]